MKMLRLIATIVLITLFGLKVDGQNIGNCQNTPLEQQLIDRLNTGGTAVSELVQIICNSQGLSITLPSQLGSFPNLQLINLAEQQIQGPIPTQLGDATSLLEFRIQGNKLSKPIPSQLSSLVSLTVFDVERNDLTGTFPNELLAWTNIQRLHVSQNKLTGTMPNFSAAGRDFDFAPGQAVQNQNPNDNNNGGGGGGNNNNDNNNDNGLDPNIIIGLGAAAGVVALLILYGVFGRRTSRSQNDRLANDLLNNKENYDSLTIPNNYEQNLGLGYPRMDKDVEMGPPPVQKKGMGKGKGKARLTDEDYSSNTLKNVTILPPQKGKKVVYQNQDEVATEMIQLSQLGQNSGRKNRKLNGKSAMTAHPGWFTKKYGLSINLKKATKNWFDRTFGQIENFDDHDEIDDIREEKEKTKNRKRKRRKKNSLFA